MAVRVNIAIGEVKGTKEHIFMPFFSSGESNVMMSASSPLMVQRALRSLMI